MAQLVKAQFWNLEALKKLDHVAYVRFASIYRSFEDIDAFRQTIKTLEAELNE